MIKDRRGWSTVRVLGVLISAAILAACGSGSGSPSSASSRESSSTRIVVPTVTPSATATVRAAPQPGTFALTDAPYLDIGEGVMVVLSDGRVLVLGDFTSPSPQVSSQIYDPGTETFSFTGDMVDPGGLSNAILLHDGKVLVLKVGGTIGPDAELYDPTSGTFSLSGSYVVPRGASSVALLNDGRVLVAGGMAYSGGSITTYFASAEIYDPATGMFTLTGSMHTARENATATLLPDGRVLIAGGDQGDRGDDETILSSAEIYDPSTGQFSLTGSMTIARTSDRATLLANGSVLITGGWHYWDYQHHDALSSAEIYDPTTRKFSLTGSMGTARKRHTATALADGRVLVAGGDNESTISWGLGSAEIYDPVAGTFAWTGAMTTTRDGHAAVALKDGRVLVVGGSGYSGRSAELYWP